MRAGITHTVIALANVVAEHTQLGLPTTPAALAACVFVDGDDAVYAGVCDDAELGRRCVRRLLTQAEIDADVETYDAYETELARVLFRDGMPAASAVA